MARRIGTRCDGGSSQGKTSALASALVRVRTSELATMPTCAETESDSAVTTER
jgi:hypothetical protein